MNNGMKSQLAMLAMSMAMMPQGTNFRDTRSEDIPFEPKHPVIPKGCKEYFFNEYGIYSMVEDRGTMFKCVASNSKIAIKKFNKWKLNH